MHFEFLINSTVHSILNAMLKILGPFIAEHDVFATVNIQIIYVVSTIK